MSDSLKFDPNERVTPHSVESIRPLARKVVSTDAPNAATDPVATPMPPPSVTAPAHTTPPPIQARPVPPRNRPVNTLAQQMGRVATSQPAPEPVPVPEPVAVEAAPLVLPRSSSTVAKPITATFEDTGLPSSFAPYDWKDIQIRRLTIEELRAVVRARVGGNLRHLVRAVDATISRNAWDLTVGDFWYIMYWHRINSYKKSPFIIQWECNNIEHIHSVNVGDLVPVSDEEVASLSPEELATLLSETTEEGVEYFRTVKMDKATLSNTLPINGSNLRTTEIDPERYVAERDAIESEYGIRITPQRLIDLVHSLEQQENKRHTREAAAAKEEKATAEGDVSLFIQAIDEEAVAEDEELAFMHRYAALLDPVHGASLDNRATVLNGMEPDLLADLEDFLVVSEHGVEESWQVKCKGCGASRTVKQSLDALTFLPSLQRGGLAES